MNDDKLKEKLIEIFNHDLKKVDEFITFYLMIKRFGSNYVKKIYPGQVYSDKIKLLKKLNFVSDFEKVNLQDSNSLSNNLNSINIEWIRYFVILSETKNFDVAAYKLNISVRALQKAVSVLENSLKVKLIYGKGNFKGLTYAGNIFLEESRYILQNFHDLDKKLNNLRTEKEIIRINVVWINLYFLNVLSNTISILKGKFPEIYFKVNLIANYDIEKWVENGEADIGLTVSKPSMKSIGYIEGKKYPYVIVGKPQKKRDWKELRYILPSTDFYGNSEWIQKILGNRIISEFDLTMVLDLCEKGIASSFLPMSVIENEIESNSLAIIADPPVEHNETPYIIFNNNISKNKFISHFIEETMKKIG